MFFCFNCEKQEHIEIECPESNEKENLNEIEPELISTLDEVKKEREENISLLIKQKESVQIFEESHKVIEKLRAQLEEARKIKENLEGQKQCLESNIATQKEEAEKREKILTDHIKERTNDLNHLEAKFGQEERRLEEEIITLKIQLEEAKRIEEVMKIQMMNKE
jgi:hypothetical protein